MKTRILILAIAAGLGFLAALVLVRLHGVSEAGTDMPSTSPAPRAAAEPAVPATPQLPAAPRAQAAGAAGNVGSNADVIGSSDPKSKDYDPVTVNRVTNAIPSSLFEKEPRDPAFAGPREAALRERLTARLRKRVAFDAAVEAECHTSSCQISVRGASSAEEMSAALAALDLSRLADATQIGPGPDPKQHELSIVLLYSTADRDPATYDRTMKRYEAHDEPPTHQ